MIERAHKKIFGPMSIGAKLFSTKTAMYLDVASDKIGELRKELACKEREILAGQEAYEAQLALKDLEITKQSETIELLKNELTLTQSWVTNDRNTIPQESLQREVQDKKTIIKLISRESIGYRAKIKKLEQVVEKLKMKISQHVLDDISIVESVYPEGAQGEYSSIDEHFLSGESSVIEIGSQDIV